MTVLTLALLAGSQPAAPRLAPVHQIGPQSRRQSPHTPCAPLVRTDALTVTWQKADRYKRSAPTSSSHTPWPNPHSACGTAAAPLPAISCLGAFRPPAARARGEVRHCRQPKTCTLADITLNAVSTAELASPGADLNCSELARGRGRVLFYSHPFKARSATLWGLRNVSSGRRGGMMITTDPQRAK